MRFIGHGRRRRFSCSSYNSIADNNKPVPSSHAHLFRHNSRSIVPNRHFFHPYNTPLLINRCTVKSLMVDASRSRRVVSGAMRDREIKSNATSAPVTIDDGIFMGDAPGRFASGCRCIALLAHTRTSISSINHRRSRGRKPSRE